jgi:predicted RNase H-like HicB family nuclease
VKDVKIFNMYRNFNVMVWPEDGVYIAKCPENSVASQGMMEQEAIDGLREALELYYERKKASASATL